MYFALTPTVLASLRESARLYTTHYSTMIEGNLLAPDQIEVVLKHEGHFPGRERDEHEVKGYYAALTKVEQAVAACTPLSEKLVQTLHDIAMGQFKLYPYRDGQNAIHNSHSGAIVSMPPESKDVPGLMAGMIDWINQSHEVPCPILAAIVHYQFATIHPYYDGNGRTARLLTTLILHLGGYDLKGLYSLEEYYARNLPAYYEAISIGPSHNYYLGRAEVDITRWVEYFIEGMAVSFENVLNRMKKIPEAQGVKDQSDRLRKLDPRQRKVLELFQAFEAISSGQVAALFDLKPRTSSELCRTWVGNGFLGIINTAKKSRKYKLSKDYEGLIGT